jgi:hypothetical protein
MAAERDAALRLQAAAEEAGKLRAERALLKRSLIAEREAGAALRADLQRREGECRAQLERIDALGAERARLGAAVQQLRAEAAASAEQRALMGGSSMLSTLLTSADGSAAEITRLREQQKLMEEELAAQIKNAGRVHEASHAARRAHEAEAARLRRRAEEAVAAGEALEVAADAARSDLELSRRQAAEVARQLSTKAALCQDLQRALDSKSEALRYVQALRESDLKAAQQRFQARVPFDDRADPALGLEHWAGAEGPAPRPALEALHLRAAAAAAVEATRAAGAQALSWLTECRRAAPPPAELPALCAALQQLARSAAALADAADGGRAAQRQSPPQSRAQLEARARADLDAAAAAWQALAAASDPRFAALRRSTSAAAALRRAAGAGGTPRLQDAIGALSDLAAALRGNSAGAGAGDGAGTASDTDTGTGASSNQFGAGDDGSAHRRNSSNNTRHELAFADLFANAAKQLHEWCMQRRSLMVDSASRRASRGFVARINHLAAAAAAPRSALQSAPAGSGAPPGGVTAALEAAAVAAFPRGGSSGSAAGDRAGAAELRKRLVAQSEKLARLEAQYLEARSALTSKEKALRAYELSGSDAPRQHEQGEHQLEQQPKQQRQGQQQQDVAGLDLAVTPPAPPPHASTGRTGPRKGYELLVIDTRDGSLAASLRSHATQLQHGSPENSTDPHTARDADAEECEAVLEALADRARVAEARAIEALARCRVARQESDKLAVERARDRARADDLAREVAAVRAAMAEELQLTRRGYDAKLQQLTQHLMRVQDDEQERQAEVYALKEQLAQQQLHG